MASHSNPPQSAADTSAARLRGLLVEFDSPTALLTAATKVRDAGYRRWDTHSPFPVHGIDAAMGVRPTKLPYLVLLCAAIGTCLGLGLQWWTNATLPGTLPAPNFVSGYAFWISGKPDFSLPANIPVIFELTVLLAALAAVFGMLIFNNLPRHHNPLFNVARFKRVTADRFFLAVDAADQRFSADGTAAFLATLGGAAVEPILDDHTPAALPPAFRTAAVVVGCLLLFPPLVVAYMRVSQSAAPRIHIIQDMDNQERFKSQQAHPVFADTRALRPQAAHTLARSDWPRDPWLHEGRRNGDYADAFPPGLTVDEAFVTRGQQRFNIYCATCHGYNGNGQGVVHERALRLDTPGWVQPSVLVDDLVNGRALGHIFETITYGRRTMPPYGDQIPPEDRWAIIAYVRALALSQNVPATDLPAGLVPPQRP